MAKQTVNIGTNQDDGTGDVLRDAFKKINENFDEVYTELGGTSLSGLSFSGTTIGTDTASDSITLDVTGTGQIVLAGPVSASETLAVTGNTTLTGTLDVDGNTTLDAVAISETLAVTGATTLTGALSGSSITLTGALTVGGTSTLNGSVDIGDSSSDTVTITGRVDSSIVPSATETNNLGSSSLRWANIYAKDGDFSGNITLGGNITVGDGDSDSITINADLTSNLIPDADSTYDLGTISKKWKRLYVDTVNASAIAGATTFAIGNLSFSGNSVGNVLTNQNITLDPQGTGRVVIPRLSVSNIGNNEVLFATTSGQVSSYSGFTHSGTTTSLEQLVVNDLRLDNNNITSSSNIELQPASGIIDVKNAVIDNLGTPTLGDHATHKDYVDQQFNQGIIFVGNDSTGFAYKLGETLNVKGTNGISTVVGDTSLTISNSDTWTTLIDRLGKDTSAAGIEGLEFSRVTVDAIRINQNEIVTKDSNADLELGASGTGSVIIKDTNFKALQTMEVTGAATFSSTLGVTGDATFSTVNTDGLKIVDNNIQGTRSSENINLIPNGTGNVALGQFIFETNQSVGAGQDNYILTYDHGAGTIKLEANAGAASPNLDGAAAAVVSVANDSIAIIDADDSNATKKESIADFVSAVASTGLSASAGQITIDGTVATLAGSQTLTNKTLTSPAIDTITHTSDFILNVDGDIVLDADGGDVYLRDGSAGNFGYFTRAGSNDLTIASGATQAIIFTGANAAFQGNITTTGTLNTHTIPGGTGTIALTSTVQGAIATAGNTGSGSIGVGDTLQALGTTNEIDVDAAGSALSFSLADNISGIVSVSTTGLKIVENNILGTRSNDDIVLVPNGTGAVKTTAPVHVGSFVGGIDILTGGGAIRTDTLTTEIVTTGAQAFSLADGALGQIKILNMKTHGGDATITPDTFSNATNIIFNAKDDNVTLVFTSNGWVIIAGQSFSTS